MGNNFFQFKQFKIVQSRCAMKVTTDSCLFGAWVANAVDHTQSILDIGAGTGLLGLMLAQQFPYDIDAIEIESECFLQLKENIEESKWKEKFTLYHEDIRHFRPTKKFDLIISNPPFYENQLNSENINVNLARHSNALSLVEIFEAVDRLISPNGFFFILLPSYRELECIELAAKFQLYPDRITTVKQTPLHSSFRVMISFSGTKKEILQVEEITIKNIDNIYSDQFGQLLSEYYLHL